ncbi:MAG: CHAT domain-containing tetratricopeptide repeat protein [Pyrinomonadaceae bacterium]
MVRPTQSHESAGSAQRAVLRSTAAAACWFLLWSYAAGSTQTVGGTLAQTQRDVDTSPLKAGQPVEREMKGGETHAYLIRVEAGRVVRLLVEQKGIDVVVALLGAGDKPLIEVDNNLSGTRGPEEVSLVSATSETYRVEVRSLEKNASAGSYEIRVAEMRAATETDHTRVAAQRAYVEAARLQGERTSESRRQAIARYAEALRLLRVVADRRAEAMALTNTGMIYNLLGEPRRALEYLDQALPLTQAIGDRQLEATTLSIIGRVHYALGELQKALDDYGRALPVLRAAGDRSGEAGVLTSMGTVYRLLGEPQKALDYFTQALPLWRAVGDGRGEATALNNLGTVYRLLGKPRQALRYFDQVLPLVRAVGDRRVEAATLTNMGTIYNLLGEPRRALEYLDQALPLTQAIGDRRIEAGTLSVVGTVYSMSGDQRRAVEYLNRALPLRVAVGDRQGEATTLNHLGRAYDLLGEPRRALQLYEQALPIWQSVGDRNGEVAALYGAARAESALGDLERARVRSESALLIVNSLRTKVTSEELRASYFASVQDLYELHIDLLMQLHRRQPSAGLDAAALKAYEQGRARSLLDMLVEARADIRQGVDPDLLARERALQRSLNSEAEQQSRLLAGRHTDEEASAARRKIDDLLTQFTGVEAELKASSPHYAALTRPAPLSLSEIQNEVVDAGTLLLEYALGEKRSYLWAVTKGSASSYELPPRVEIENAARRCYTLLTARNQYVKFETPEERRVRIRRADAEYPQAAMALSRMLLGPVAAELAGKRLLIVPDGALEYLPFAALPLPDGAAGSAPPGKAPARVRGARQEPAPFVPLIIEHEVVNIPSASTLAVLRRELRGRAPARKVVAVFADPVFDKADERVADRTVRQSPEEGAGAAAVQRALDAGSGTTAGVQTAEQMDEDETAALPRLPFTRREAEAILALAPPAERKAALDFDASREAVTAEDLSEYRVIHFATHSFLNSVHPELSGIALSMVNRRGEPQDGFLRAHEVFNLKLRAELVALSGCRTGLGKEVRGEGVFGLTRGFMYAGARRVLVSLWDVPDEATAQLMARFYQELLGPRRAPATAALRAAQVRAWRERRWPAPYYWAGFVIQGEPR